MTEIAISAEYRRNPDKSRFWVNLIHKGNAEKVDSLTSWLVFRMPTSVQS
jgi:hypothetical protein